MTATHSDPELVDGGDDDHGETGPPVDTDHAGALSSPVTRMFSRMPRWVPPVAVGGLALGSCIYVGLVDPNTSSSAFYPQCAFKSLTGLDCPGCGLTRAMHALVTGHPMRALDHNILIALIEPLAAYTYFVWLGRSLFGWELPYLRVPKYVGYALAPLLITFWVVRNLPFAPFTYLNSTAAGV